MRSDFSEERRWKRVEAVEFVYQIALWHLKRPDEKASLMVGGRGWGRSNDTPIPGRADTEIHGSGSDAPVASVLEDMAGTNMANEPTLCGLEDAMGEDEDAEGEEDASEPVAEDVAAVDLDAEGEVDGDVLGEAFIGLEGG